MQQADSKQHIRLADGNKDQAKLHAASSGTVSLQSGSGQHIGHDDQVTRTEIVMLFRLVKHDYSFSSCDDLTNTLKYLFASDAVVRCMSLGSTKSGYSLAYGLGPHFHLELIKDVQRKYFRLVINETTTEQSKNQLDYYVKYWSLQQNRTAYKIPWFQLSRSCNS